MRAIAPEAMALFGRPITIILLLCTIIYIVSNIPAIKQLPVKLRKKQ